MPLNSSISASDVATIRQWIRNLEPLAEDDPALVKLARSRRSKKPAPLTDDDETMLAQNPQQNDVAPGENVAASDESTAQITEAAPAPQSSTERFIAVRKIFTRQNSCIMCHASNIAKYSEDEFREKLSAQGEPLVVPGSARSSALFKKLRGSGVSKTFATMPPEPFPALSSQDIDTIRRWIDEMPSQSAPMVHFRSDEESDYYRHVL